MIVLKIGLNNKHLSLYDIIDKMANNEIKKKIKINNKISINILVNM
jgi:hypothetical protein